MNVALGPEVFNRAAIKIKVAFEEKSFKANQTVGMSVYLCNNVPGTNCISKFNIMLPLGEQVPPPQEVIFEGTLSIS